MDVGDTSDARNAGDAEDARNAWMSGVGVHWAEETWMH